jgi:hypothetical protein
LLDNVNGRSIFISHFNLKEVSSCQKFDLPTIDPTPLVYNKIAPLKLSKKKKTQHRELRLSEK